ncbi:Regulating synaptic membrane exocytosis protein 2 [Goodea atripinnis]|uniref:Regulating synaptic membrane exocytosis protein 2 n=1 Tax=Goodea atripinnis TaxID=208336 RepID=A0ABV0PJL3_9TELE
MRGIEVYYRNICASCCGLHELYLVRLNRGAMDRHEFHSRSRSADQRPTIERLSSRSRSSERPHDSSLMRSMPSLPSGRSAPPSPAMTRCDPEWRG